MRREKAPAAVAKTVLAAASWGAPAGRTPEGADLDARSAWTHDELKLAKVPCWQRHSWPWAA